MSPRASWQLPENLLSDPTLHGLLHHGRSHGSVTVNAFEAAVQTAGLDAAGRAALLDLLLSEGIRIDGATADGRVATPVLAATSSVKARAASSCRPARSNPHAADRRFRLMAAGYAMRRAAASASAASASPPSTSRRRRRCAATDCAHTSFTTEPLAAASARAA